MSWRWEVEPQKRLAAVVRPMMLPLFARSMQHYSDALAKGESLLLPRTSRVDRQLPGRASWVVSWWEPYSFYTCFGDVAARAENSLVEAAPAQELNFRETQPSSSLGEQEPES